MATRTKAKARHKLPVIEIPWRKGMYLARVNGPSAKWGIDLEWETGPPAKSRHVLKFAVTPGWYAARLKARKGPPDTFYRVDKLSAAKLPESLYPYIQYAPEGPLPGEPGEWSGVLCECGGDVAMFTEHGFPVCDDCNTEVTA